MTTWQELADSAASCTRCDLYQRATATVFGEGRTAAGSMVLLLGAVAGEAVFGSRFRVGDHKGKVEDAAFGAWRGLVVSTIHPSVVLREDDPEARERSYAGLVADLVTAREAARG